MFEDTFHQLRSRTPDEIKLKLNVTFSGEEGIDAGGVTREWYQVGEDRTWGIRHSGMIAPLHITIA